MTAARSLANLTAYNPGLLADIVATSTGSNDVPVIIKGASGQTADLLQFKDSSGTIISKIDSSGEYINPGAVIQVQTVKLTSNGVMTTPTSWTTATDGTTPMSLSFTPKLTNSLIKIEWLLQGVMNAADLVGWCAPFKDANSLFTGESTGMIGGQNIGEAWKYSYGSSGDTNIMNTFSGHWLETNNNTTTRAYSLRVKTRSGNFFINRSEANNASQTYSTQGRSILTVTEIAQ